MQSTDLNQEVQNIAIPQSIINIFAQSLYAQLEALAFDANASLELFENQEYTQVKTFLQANIQQMQYALNSVEILGRIEQKTV
ncbi:hypothetical protein [Microscilla marina]|uniref:Uncharacterized protein n=1 Tax=Microscilla marina ATCC 23134 TaxID=313606 RepID=A1ZPF9_MICM2|nr:hypothetical protein [Microscilla marina]EAY27698.1 hypothetical protein M23134_03766 [Microscilla marina ATCC 23134]